MAMRRPVSERNLPNAGLRSRGFRVIRGGGAYGQRRPSKATSNRSLTPYLGPNSSLSSLRSAVQTRLQPRRSPASLIFKRPLQRATSFARRPKPNFSPEYLQELGHMLRLQVRSSAQTIDSNRSIEIQASRGSLPRRLVQLVTCSQWPGSNGK
jgi:hypothetical protein